MKKSRLSVLLIFMMFCVLFCVACGKSEVGTEPVPGSSNVTDTGNGAEGSDAVPETTEAPQVTMEPEEGLTGKTYDPGVFLMTGENVKLLGRTWLNNDIRWLSFSASGVEFQFTGKSCSFSLRADSMYSNKNHQARYAIYVDGELVIDEMMDKGIKEVPVLQADAVEEHVIRFVKLSETSDSSLGLQYITCDADANIQPTEEKDLLIEFVGDSITCGYGVDGELGDVYLTGNEDATKAYAFLTAQKLDADWSLVSQSGYGIISGYTNNGKKQEKQALPLYYDKVGNSYGTAGGVNPSEKEWKFNRLPDVVVINLGTNDNSYTKNDATKKEEYVQGYVAFLEKVREKNPDAEIVCTLGVMGQELCPQIEKAVEQFSTEKNDTKVHYVKLDVQAYENGWAVDYHPTAASHEHAAEQMSKAISEILK